MKEHEPRSDPYWQEDLALGEGRFAGDPFTVRLRLHTARETYRGQEELVKLRQPTGERVYLHARPYLLVPEVVVTIGLYPTPRPTGEIGAVERSEWTGLRHQEIGTAQGWGYPAEGLVVLWECFLHERWRREDPVADDNLALLWRGFEAHLLVRCPGAARIITPSWEDLYARERWQAFLRQEGYQPVNPQAFAKEVGGKSLELDG